MHHLLLSEEPDLRLNDLLQIESFVPAATADVRDIDQGSLRAIEDDVDAGSENRNTTELTSATPSSSNQRNVLLSPLANILDCPTYIPQLYFRIRIILSNLWNEFICNYDPSMVCHQSMVNSGSPSSPSNGTDLCSDIKPKHYVSTIFASLLISFVTIIADFFKGYHATQSNPLIKMKFLMNLVKREIRKRNLSWAYIWQAISRSFNPVQMMKTALAWTWWALVTISLMWPYWAYREFVAFRCCAFLGNQYCFHRPFTNEYQ